MKKKDKYKIINYAINEYSEIFNCKCKRTNMSKKKVKELLEQYKHSVMCEWKYCCYGLYQNCWQETYFEGCWNMTQKQVDETISETFNELKKACKRDNRIAYCEEDGAINVVIIARDLPEFKADFLITFTNSEEWWINL